MHGGMGPRRVLFLKLGSHRLTLIHPCDLHSKASSSRKPSWASQSKSGSFSLLFNPKSTLNCGMIYSASFFLSSL